MFVSHIRRAILFWEKCWQCFTVHRIPFPFNQMNKWGRYTCLSNVLRVATDSHLSGWQFLMFLVPSVGLNPFHYYCIFNLMCHTFIFLTLDFVFSVLVKPLELAGRLCLYLLLFFFVFNFFLFYCSLIVLRSKLVYWLVTSTFPNSHFSCPKTHIHTNPKHH